MDGNRPGNLDIVSTRRPIRSETWEGATWWTRALILRDGDSAPAQISDVNSWSVRVYDGGTQVYALANQSPSDAFSNTLRTAGWDGVEAGYNFARPLTPSDFAWVGGVTYQAEFTIATVSDGTLQVVHITEIQGLYSV